MTVGPLAGRVRWEGTTLVTGSTDGLGREVAVRLGALGATVIVHGRNARRGADVVREIQAGGQGSAVFYAADFASLDQVRRLADTVLERHGRLDLLINNAGIFTDGIAARRTSHDGHELVFAVNYLAGFALTERLLPLIGQSASARIVHVASIAQQPLDMGDVMLSRGFSPSRAYAQSKLAQVMHAFDLAALTSGTRITVNCLHPATLMKTTMVARAGMAPLSTVAEGADGVMHLAISPVLDGQTGLYFEGMHESRAHQQAYDPRVRSALRGLSVTLTGEGAA